MKNLQPFPYLGLILITVVVGYTYFSNDDEEQPTVLYDEIRRGNIMLDVSGIGDDTGPVIRGYLINKTPEAKMINTTLIEPLYLDNENSFAQNMLTTRVYRYDEANRDKKYIESYPQHIKVRSNEHVPIVFIAYCNDPSKNNPSRGDKFRVTALPRKFDQILDNAKRYRAKNEGVDVIDAVQIAIWHTQGVEWGVISRRVDVDEQDRRIANTLLRRG